MPVPRLPLVVLLVVGLCLPGFAQQSPDLLLQSPPSTKIWDDFSLANVSSKGHKFLGYATVTLGAAAFLVKKLEDDAPGTASNAHRILGESAAIAAGTTVAAGLVAHWDKLSFSGDLATWNNLHALTALAGASLMASTAFLNGAELHSKLAIAGTALMGLAIVFEG
jgi:hypothetical protein